MAFSHKVLPETSRPTEQSSRKAFSEHQIEFLVTPNF
jgi:hypothetical protein